MTIGLGIACSHSPILYRPRSSWEKIYGKLTGDVAQPNRSKQETPKKLDEYFLRIQSSLLILKKELETYKPDHLIVVLSDTSQVFGRRYTPQLSIFTGAEFWGSGQYSELGESHIGHRITIEGSPEMALFLADELTELGFDINENRVFQPVGNTEAGVPASLINCLSFLLESIPSRVIPLFVNAHVNPAISGHRMPELGNALAKVGLLTREKIAILGLGGLSGDPGGYLAGWIDESLDQWVISRLKRGRSEELKSIWDLDSDTVRGQTREIRNWIVTASAMEAIDAQPKILDYIPLHHATVGIAFAVWKPAL